MKWNILGLMAVGLLAGPMAAQAATFGFEFDNSTGNVSGSVTGRIFGLQDNLADQAATSVLIDSFPLALAANDGLADRDAVNWAILNFFTVENGLITEVTFGGQADFNFNTVDTFALGAFSYGTICCGQINSPFLTLDSGRTFVGGGALRFYRIVDVPEPGTLALFGLGLVGMSMRRRIKAS